MRLPPLIPATLIRRYKRFLADCVLDTGKEITVHAANPGSMLGLAEPGSRIWLSRSTDSKRKLAYSWELVEAQGGLVNINTSRSNAIVAEAIATGLVPGLTGYASLRPEVRYGVSSRIDFLLEDPVRGRAFVEVKSVTLSRAAGLAEFPDAVTLRGAKHLVELTNEVVGGHRAVMLYLVQIPSSIGFAIARDIDPRYGAAFDLARAAGVEVIACLCRVTTTEISVVDTIPLVG